MGYVIVDIDGTLANNKHREHLIQGVPKRWDMFFDLCHLDTPIQPVVDLVKVLMQYHQIIFCTGRPARVGDMTAKWLHGHGLVGPIIMRDDGDHRPDHVIKLEMLKQLIEYRQSAPEFVLDDRDSTVAMWRKEGIVCLQCAPGNF